MVAGVQSLHTCVWALPDHRAEHFCYALALLRYSICSDCYSRQWHSAEEGMCGKTVEAIEQPIVAFAPDTSVS